MKEIAVIAPVNNPNGLIQQDLAVYQTSQCHFTAYRIEEAPIELNCTEDVEKVLPLVIDKALTLAQAGTSAIIIAAFGDVGVTEIKAKVNIPVIGLGKVVIPVAAEICRQHFSIIPAMPSHPLFIDAMIKELNLEHKYIAANASPNIGPAQVKIDKHTLPKLFEAACTIIDATDVDTLTIGCGSFFGTAAPLQQRLREKYPNKPITVLDPMAVPLQLMSML